MNLLDRVFEPELEILTDLLTDTRSAEDRLIIYTERSSEVIIKTLKWMPLFYDFIALAFRQDLIKKTITKFYKQNIDLLVILIQQGIDTGEFKAVNALDAAVAISAIIEGTMMLWLYNPEQIEIKAQIKSNVQLLMHGLKTSD